MALIKLGNGIIEIRGRFGGVYFKTGPDGQHVQAMPRVWKYPRSPAQQGIWGGKTGFFVTGISGFSGAAGLWGLALLGFFGAMWLIFAMSYMFVQAGKEPKKITGYNWYVHYALAFPECERPPFWKPPHSPGELPSFITNYQGLWTYEHSPLEWPVDCCTDYYWQGIVWNGKRTYHNDDFTWFIWWKDPLWVISTGVDFEDPQTTFYSSPGEILGYYKNPVTGKYASNYYGRAEERELPH